MLFNLSPLMNKILRWGIISVSPSDHLPQTDVSDSATTLNSKLTSASLAKISSSPFAKIISPKKRQFKIIQKTNNICSTFAIFGLV